MTQPSVNTTFDTSIVDLNPNVSFSTTESDPSDAGMSTATQKVQPSAPSPLAQDINQTTPQSSQLVPPKTSTPVQHIGTQDAYDQWASVYDSDGNMLQSIDDDELNTLLPSLLNQIATTSGPSISVLDLGCGTGRNTARLLSHSWPADTIVAVTGLDFSAGMLALARTKLSALTESNKAVSLRLEQCDPFPTSNDFTPSTIALPPQNLVTSTLVLEHIPLPTYFSTLTSLLAPGGVALVTNMHSEMGSRSQAGFVNAQGVKVRGESFVYSLAEAVQAAQDAGLQLVEAKERSMEEEDVRSGVVGKRGRKWIGCKVWFGIVLRKA
ncbi:S-adenosyl-L-methionine-dependent methyltransferase [Macroventuria anomochaeta]|uniref:S-adenosyl-L-methionine-dependent methyltransferase n=1 Tax=Macroventuria anomochaeta TaxID=301207 RepID=A0ACB6SG88_9PLEO|nr:S-adenosyl-L-methionine-dependent methyltransferase [Macroventuria anomochaeta]KAF2632972.1 S-adenosyl-L-methionine-dependent methyltransferase [Macroventuria anomochaeta]